MLRNGVYRDGSAKLVKFGGWVLCLVSDFGGVGLLGVTLGITLVSESGKNAQKYGKTLGAGVGMNFTTVEVCRKCGAGPGKHEPVFLECCPTCGYQGPFQLGMWYHHKVVDLRKRRDGLTGGEVDVDELFPGFWVRLWRWFLVKMGTTA